MNQGARNDYCRYPYTKGVELIYDLTPQTLLFLDIGLIFPGQIVWESEGKPHPMHAGIGYYGEQRFSKEEISGQTFRSAPYGLVFEAQKAKTGPETELGGTVIYDNGVYRSWYMSPVKDPNAGKGFDLAHDKNMLCYAESHDGITLQKPQFDFIKAGGAKSNAIFGSKEQVGETGFSGESLFMDPSAQPEERFKMMYTGKMPIPKLLECAARNGQEVDPLSLAIGKSNKMGMVIFGAVSPDGYEWTTIQDPIMMFMSEGGGVYYDASKKSYVNYIRYWQASQRRGIGVAETKDFRNWPNPRPLMLPGFSNPLTSDYYTNAHALVPGHEDVHLFFVADYDRGLNDQTDVRMAVSLDGDVFDFVPGGHVIERSPDWDPDTGPWDGGCIFPRASGMHPFGKDHIGIIYSGYNVPHKWPRTVQWKSATRWALWEKDRLVALKAPLIGGFATPGMVLTKPALFINAETDMAGRICCEIMDELGHPLPGYKLEHCDPIVGNHRRKALSWQGKFDLSELVGRTLFLRFQLMNCKLYSICADEWRSV